MHGQLGRSRAAHQDVAHAYGSGRQGVAALYGLAHLLPGIHRGRGTPLDLA